MKILIVCSYAQEDRALLNELKSRLKSEQHDPIDIWYDRDISAGDDWAQTIDESINKANVILPLVSQYSLDSDYFYGIETRRAIERHERGEAQVIPILLRPVYYERTPFAKLQVLPTNGKPVITWPDLDEAFYDVVEGIRAVASQLARKSQTSRENEVQWLREIDELGKAGHYAEALAACERVLPLSNENSKIEVWYKKGIILRALKHYEEALVVFEHILALDTIKAEAWYDKGTVLRALERYEEAIHSFELAELLAPGATDAQYNKEITLQILKSLGRAPITSTELTYSIDQVAAQTGLTMRTLRYYEEVGLLSPTDRTEGNYRCYSAEDIQRIELIKKLRDLLGLSLADIRAMFKVGDERGLLKEANRPQKPKHQENQERFPVSTTVLSITDETVIDEILSTEQMVVATFLSSKSNACQIFESEFMAVAQEYHRRITFVKVDVTEQMDLAKRWNISGVPTTIFFRGSQEIHRINGIVMRDKLRRQIEGALIVR